MAEAAVNVDNEQEELERSIAYCDRRIREGDELERDFFKMVRRTLISKESKFEEWDAIARGKV